MAVFYIFCFTGNTFAGYYNGTGRVLIPFLGALGHITLRVLLSWLLFPHFGLPAVALATGLGWICANVFWGILKRERYYGRRFTSREELVKMIEDYIAYYNAGRLQRGLGVLSPFEKHEQYLAA